MSSPVLSLRGIRKSFNHGMPNEVPVLLGVDLAISAGEIVGLLAPSGAGKSTLLHIAGLLDSPTCGRIVIADNEMTAAPDRLRTITRRRMVGFVYQFHYLLPEFTALENIVLPQLANAVPRDTAVRWAEHLLQLVGLDERAGHRPAELSGGEQQRAAICRALANNPKILLADEPTGNLDVDTAEAVFGAMTDLARTTGLAALVATHNLHLAGRMDRTVRLEHGVIA